MTAYGDGAWSPLPVTSGGVGVTRLSGVFDTAVCAGDTDSDTAVCAGDTDSDVAVCAGDTDSDTAVCAGDTDSDTAVCAGDMDSFLSMLGVGRGRGMMSSVTGRSAVL